MLDLTGASISLKLSTLPQPDGSKFFPKWIHVDALETLLKLKRKNSIEIFLSVPTREEL